MNASPFHKFVLRFRILLILIPLSLIGIVVYLVINPPERFFCTMMGCFDSLEISFATQPTQEYSIQLTSNSGETRAVTCTPGKYEARYPGSTSNPVICGNSSVTFLEFSPKEVTVEVIWQGGSFTSTERPSYEGFRPNGPYCAPECRRGKLLLEIP